MMPTPKLVFFDLDHTLIPIDSDHEWSRFMVRTGLADAQFTRAAERFRADYLAGCLDSRAWLHTALAPLTRHSRAQLARWHAQFMQQIITPALHPSALALVRNHQRNGDLCCMITATHRFITAPIAAAFGIPHLIAPEPATLDGSPNAAYNGALDGLPCYRESKVTRARAWLQALGQENLMARSVFYSDSFNDIPLLDAVSEPIATNPDDTLRAHALSKGWRILELFKAT